ncbi:MAG TPA: hypothetical protein EYN88_02535 [Candidatus Poseidoniales archaeon]|nr:hypothetical protein [Candidatus Poseidoniales archaeon]
MGCNLRDLAESEVIDIADLAGKRVGIDSFLVAFQFLTAMRARGATGDGGPLKDGKGRPVSHLMGFLDRSLAPFPRHNPARRRGDSGFHLRWKAP